MLAIGASVASFARMPGRNVSRFPLSKRRGHFFSDRHGDDFHVMWDDEQSLWLVRRVGAISCDAVADSLIEKHLRERGLLL